MDFFKVWRWPQMLASTVAGLALMYAAWLYVDWRLGKHYTAKVSAEIHGQYAAAAKDAYILQRKADAKAAENFKAGQVVAAKVLDKQLIEVTVYAKSLPENSACLADAEFVRLYNGGRAR